jgi:hypothetical protein
MRKITLFLLFAFVTLGITKAQQTNDVSTSKANIVFEKEIYDYGTVEYGGNGISEFKFKNTGTEPLIISNARGSCGCTVPDWPRNPIPPGGSGVIKVSYDTKRPGPINKQVTITSNAGNDPNKVIRIAGNVEPEKANTFPITKSPEGPAEKTK